MKGLNAIWFWRQKGWALALLVALALVTMLGCGGNAGLPGGDAPQPPAGCEKSVLWSRGFMPLGPGLVVTAASTALIAEPQAAPGIRLACAAAYRTLGTGSLAEVTGALSGNDIGKFFVPVLTLFEQWSKAGVIQGAQVQLDPCDRQILKDLLRDIAITAGGNPGDFQ